MNNIDSKINMLYDFIYVKSSNNIKPYNIDVKNITIDDIKIKKNDSSDYMDIITELFNCKLKMITYDINAKTLVLKRSNEAPSIALFITPYKSLSKIDNINSINNNDSLFSYLLSMLVINKKCKHIMLPIINIDVDFQQIVDIIKPYDNAYEDYMKLINNTLVSNIFSIRTTECFFKCMLLKDFIKSQKFNLKNLLFQVIYTLAILQKEYDGFRHNILNLDNIFVYLLKEYDNMLLEQNGVCAICENENPPNSGSLAVDHNHTTGEVRGLLCIMCNRGLGNFYDNIQNLSCAIQYLSKD